MKANELMIGDWVISSSGEPFRIGIIDLDFLYWNDIKPIPLTAEILEKNGFKKGKLNINPQYCLEDNNGFIGVTLEDIPDKHKGVDIAKGRLYFQLDISRMEEPLYVHQLQHALRLCGIKKEIEL